MNLKDEKDWSDEDRNLYNDALTKADHDRCVQISTESAIREMVKPGLMAVTASAARSLQIDRSLKNRSLKAWLGHLNTEVIPEARSELFANLNRPADFGTAR